MDFKFIHAADLHLDSPLRGLSVYEDSLREQVQLATREAFKQLIDYCLESRAAFLILAGDLFDGTWKDVSVGFFFNHQIKRLTSTGIQVFIVYGNHDAQCILGESQIHPELAHVFAADKPQTILIDNLEVALHGQSFGQKEVMENLAQKFPGAKKGYLNIGILHTNADQSGGPHANYAPCSISDLVAKNYDYWALGHVHKNMILHETPWVVFPGNLQGRHIKETGAKGFVEVEVKAGKINSVRHQAINVVRWEKLEIKLEGLDSAVESIGVIKDRVELYNANGANSINVFRVILKAPSPLYDVLIKNKEYYRRECRYALPHLNHLEKFLIEELETVNQKPDLLKKNEYPEWWELSDRIINTPEFLTDATKGLASLFSAIPRDEESDDTVIDSVDIEQARKLLFAHLSGGEENED